MSFSISNFIPSEARFLLGVDYGTIWHRKFLNVVLDDLNSMVSHLFQNSTLSILYQDGSLPFNTDHQHFQESATLHSRSRFSTQDNDVEYLCKTTKLHSKSRFSIQDYGVCARLQTSFKVPVFHSKIMVYLCKIPNLHSRSRFSIQDNGVCARFQTSSQTEFPLN